MSSDFFYKIMVSSKQSENLKLLRQKLRLTQQAFADSIGEKQTKIKDIETDKQKISLNFAIKVEKIHHINFRWLLTGEGNMYDEFDYDNCIKIPKHGEVEGSLGLGKEVFSEEVTEHIPFPKVLFNKIGANPEHCSIINTSGSSMRPTIIGGEDMVMVDVSQTEVFDGKIYLIRIENSLFVKRLQKLPKGQLKVISDNPEYDSYIIDLKDETLNFAVIGRIVWISRTL